MKNQNEILHNSEDISSISFSSEITDNYQVISTSYPKAVTTSPIKSPKKVHNFENDQSKESYRKSQESYNTPNNSYNKPNNSYNKPNNSYNNLFNKSNNSITISYDQAVKYTINSLENFYETGEKNNLNTSIEYLITCVENEILSQSDLFYISDLINKCVISLNYADFLKLLSTEDKKDISNYKFNRKIVKLVLINPIELIKESVKRTVESNNQDFILMLIPLIHKDYLLNILIDALYSTFRETGRNKIIKTIKEIKTEISNNNINNGNYYLNNGNNDLNHNQNDNSLSDIKNRNLLIFDRKNLTIHKKYLINSLIKSKEDIVRICTDCLKIGDIQHMKNIIHELLIMKNLFNKNEIEKIKMAITTIAKLEHDNKSKIDNIKIDNIKIDKSKIDNKVDNKIDNIKIDNKVDNKVDNIKVYTDSYSIVNSNKLIEVLSKNNLISKKEIIDFYLQKKDYKRLITLDIPRKIKFIAFLKLSLFNEAEDLLDLEMRERFKFSNQKKSYLHEKIDKRYIFEFYVKTKKNSSALNVLKQIDNEDVFIIILKNLYKNGSINCKEDKNYKNNNDNKSINYDNFNNDNFNNDNLNNDNFNNQRLAQNQLIIESIKIGIDKFKRSFQLLKIIISLIHAEGLEVFSRIEMLINILKKVDLKIVTEKNWLYCVVYNNILDSLDYKYEMSVELINICEKLDVDHDEFVYLKLLICYEFRKTPVIIENNNDENEDNDNNDNNDNNYNNEDYNNVNNDKINFNNDDKSNLKNFKNDDSSNMIIKYSSEKILSRTKILIYNFKMKNNSSEGLKIFKSIAIKSLNNKDFLFLLEIDSNLIHNNFKIRIELIKNAKERNLLTIRIFELIFLNISYYGPLILKNFMDEVTMSIEIKNYLTDGLKGIIKNQLELLGKINNLSLHDDIKKYLD
ncbi:hypothetical protein DMUE_0581 [Dictyocoela muelleri]|nr:hypothetical protein DMUE_0581 [Dictyocoela muelleri]